MLLKFREIEVFWAVYRGQSVKAAARTLNVSQPAVSMMLKSAEERFGVKLFERTGGRIKPTPEARALFSATNSVFLELEEFQRQVTRIKEGRVGLVRIAATPTLAAAFLHPALATFRRVHPDVRLVLRTATTDQTVEMVAQGRVDFGIAYGPSGGSGTHTEDIGVAQVACVFRADHPLAERPLIRPRDLRDETVMTYRPDTPLGRAVARLLRAHAGDMKVAIEGTALTAAYLADAGLGVALIDPFILNGGLFHHVTVRPFEPSASARVQIVTKQEEPLALVTQDLLTEIRNAVPDQFSFEIPIRDGTPGAAEVQAPTSLTSTGNRLAGSSTSIR
jgi:DNA-binding transcriptional LysR family regulator